MVDTVAQSPGKPVCVQPPLTTLGWPLTPIPASALTPCDWPCSNIVSGDRQPLMEQTQDRSERLHVRPGTVDCRRYLL